MSDLTSVDHWDDTWADDVRLRLPSALAISTRNRQRLLRRHVRPGQRVLEIGCAPGKLLAWVAAEFGAEVAGLDYSKRGIAVARRLFDALQLKADLRCEDLRHTTFAPGSFDIVISEGVIEHFENPHDVVAQHLALLKPGGTAIITVPNYRGLYRHFLRYFDPAAAELHNMDIMTREALAALVSERELFEVRTYRFGRFSPWMVLYHKRWPPRLAFVAPRVMNALALLQPFDIPALCPTLVLEVHRR